jgi:hypothetical protein
MIDSTRAGDFRICPSCASRNKAAYKYCVRCSAEMDAARAITPAAGAARHGNPRLMRFLLAAGVIAAIAVGLIVRTVIRATSEVSGIAEEVGAGSSGTVSAPPPPVSGWVPGANVPGELDAGTRWSSNSAPSWSSDSFPVARSNPYDVPGDPNASMVGIAPRAPRVRAAMARKRVFTEDDLLETRGRFAPPAPEEIRN